MVTILQKTKFRPFTLEDAQVVTDLLNAYSQDLYGWTDSTLEDNLNDWTTPGLNLKETVRVVEDEQGKIIGYVEVWDVSEPHVVKYIWAILHPEGWDESLYCEMLTWAENCARERIPLAPPDSRVVMSQGTASTDKKRKQAMEALGFQLVRNFYRMEIELDTKPQSVVLPDGLTIGPIDMEKDLKDALIAMEEGFSDHWGHVDRSIDQLMEQWQHYLENKSDFDPALWFLARDGQEIAGVCRCSPKTNEDPEMGWVNQLCVRKSWRRRGLGMALLLHAFNAFHQRGKARAGLAVDATSLTNATRLYEKAGMSVTQQYDTYDLELRPGVELTRK
jgi:ribosomal protein S18 acetylase RimI-like enzyme